MGIAAVRPDAPTDDELHVLLQTPITRLMKLLTRRGVLVAGRPAGTAGTPAAA